MSFSGASSRCAAGRACACTSSRLARPTPAKRQVTMTIIAGFDITVAERSQSGLRRLCSVRRNLLLNDAVEYRPVKTVCGQGRCKAQPVALALPLSTSPPKSHPARNALRPSIMTNAVAIRVGYIASSIYVHVHADGVRSGQQERNAPTATASSCRSHRLSLLPSATSGCWPLWCPRCRSGMAHSLRCQQRVQRALRREDARSRNARNSFLLPLRFSDVLSISSATSISISRRAQNRYMHCCSLALFTPCRFWARQIWFAVGRV